jgi:hypothetical protein
VRIRELVGVKKETYLRMREPVGVKKEHMSGYENQLVSKRNVCEDARISWCQKETYLKILEPFGVRKERM